MMIAACTFDVSVLEPTFAEWPNLSVDVEGLHAGETVPLRIVFWAQGVDPDGLETTLSADRTVEEMTRLATTDGAVLFQSIHSAERPATAIYNAAIEHDALLTAASNGGDGWEVQMRIPDRATLSAFVDRCRDLDVAVDVTSIRDCESAVELGYGLTSSQHEVITLAWNRGYFSIPREVSLSDIADELDISQQAASERLRRGLWVLISNTVCEPESVANCRLSS